MEGKRLEQLKSSISNLDKGISKLEEEKVRYKEEAEQIYRGRLERIAGLCFRKKDGDVFRILGPDLEQVTMTGRSWNSYQARAFVIHLAGPEYPDMLIPFCEDTVFTKACECEDPGEKIRSEYEEITQAEFEGILRSTLLKLAAKVMGKG